jgi:hypothetical protein
MVTSNVGPKGFQYIGDALAVNNTLRRLPLYSDKSIGDEHIRNLCQGLKVNCGLEALDLHYEGKSSSDNGINHIVDCLRNNHYLTTITLNEYLPSVPSWSEISFLLELNKLNRKIIRDEKATMSDLLNSVI